MTQRLEELFNLPTDTDNNTNDDVSEEIETLEDNSGTNITTIEDAITISEKINSALAEVKGMESHDSEMDEIAKEALASYQDLMSLGMNMSDMAAGSVFNNAAQMLKIALEAKDSKVNRKLKQIDLMLKKARLDQQTAKKEPDEDPNEDEAKNKIFDRNQLLKMLKGD